MAWLRAEERSEGHHLLGQLVVAIDSFPYHSWSRALLALCGQAWGVGTRHPSNAWVVPHPTELSSPKYQQHQGREALF